ncbi:MAG TPA: hypothetical protein VN706_06470 [Gemmatimonadaceae bacterium]|nr:hypothetical protein [Gemmatimonadaceae bacterium]
MSDPVTSPPGNLQFDRAVAGAAVSARVAGVAGLAGVACSLCGKSIKDYYYSRAGASICTSCKLAIERAGGSGSGAGVFGKAALFGLGAALAGAAVYYAVIAMFDLEIGIVAILIGYMVGRAIRASHPNAKGRKYQVLAAVLVYFSVGMAYMPLLFTEARHAARTAKTHAAATAARTPAPTDSAAAGADSLASAPPVQTKHVSPLMVLVSVIALAFALPVMAIFSSVTGIITALIIGFGIRRAWRMTAGVPEDPITGPLRLAGSAAG